MLVYVATTNPGKLHELRELSAGSGLHLVTDELYTEAPEGDSSYSDNPASKARSLRASLEARGIRAAVLADDSGLEVAALGGRPGVLSARYGGENMSWAERRAALLTELDGVEDRAARFVCTLCYIDEQGEEHSVASEVVGEITLTDRGESGFSYDAIFLYPPLGRTFGELRIREKNAYSHRARALAQLLSIIDDAGDEAAAPEREGASTNA